MLNFNGTLVSDHHLKVSNRGFKYGDAVFETLKCIGKRILFWEDHYFRLMASMRLVRMEIPMSFSPEYLEEQILDLIAAKNLQNKASRLRLTVYRKEGGRYEPESNDVDFIIEATPLKKLFYTIDDTTYEVALFKDHYLHSGILSSLKSANCLLNVVAGIFKKENGYDNCILLNEKKQLVEAINANIFVVKDTHIKTPAPTEGCVKGIIRKQLIDIIGKSNQYTLEETEITPFELQKADELFLTNVIMGIQPVSRYRKIDYSKNVATDLLKKLNAKAAIL